MPRKPSPAQLRAVQAAPLVSWRSLLSETWGHYTDREGGKHRASTVSACVRAGWLTLAGTPSSLPHRLDATRTPAGDTLLEAHDAD